MDNWITRLMKAVRLFSVFDFAIFKICLLSIGILLGIYFADSLLQFISAIWFIAVITIVYMLIQVISILNCVTNHAHRANTAILKSNFMMIPEVREFCFNISFSFLIIMTFFFMRHLSDRSFLFHGATKGIVVSDQGCFFGINTLAAGKRKICSENRMAPNIHG